MRFLRGFGQFWYDFIVGDDWKIAAAVVVVLVLGVTLVVTGALTHAVLVPVLAVLMLAAFTTALLVDVRS